jgi:hypothetical protein
VHLVSCFVRVDRCRHLVLFPRSSCTLKTVVRNGRNTISSILLIQFSTTGRIHSEHPLLCLSTRSPSQNACGQAHVFPRQIHHPNHKSVKCGAAPHRPHPRRIPRMFWLDCTRHAETRSIPAAPTVCEQGQTVPSRRHEDGCREGDSFLAVAEQRPPHRRDALKMLWMDRFRHDKRRTRKESAEGWVWKPLFHPELPPWYPMNSLPALWLYRIPSGDSFSCLPLATTE